MDQAIMQLEWNTFSLSIELWIGALQIARGEEVDLVPDELHRVITVYFSLYPPLSKA